MLARKLTYATGPIASALDQVLHDNKVQRQAYHGKAFVGNHVQKCCQVRITHVAHALKQRKINGRICVIKELFVMLQPNLIDALTKVPVEELERQLTDEMPLAAQERLRREAFQHRANFREIFQKFADVHKGINHANALTDEDVFRIGKSMNLLHYNACCKI